MKLDKLSKQIVAGIFADRESLRAEEPLCAVHSAWECSHRNDVLEVQRGTGGVRKNLAEWLGHAPSPAEFVRAHRTYARLVDAGLLEGVASGERTTHLRLTEAGEAIAQSLLKPKGQTL